MKYYVCQGEAGKGGIEVRILSKDSSGRVCTAYPLPYVDTVGYRGDEKFSWGCYGDIAVYNTAASILADCLRCCSKRVQLFYKKFANDVLVIRMKGHPDVCGIKEDFILAWMAEHEVMMGEAMKMC